ncbi:MAG: glycosyltransferase family 1 protein [Candidatus Falkowbacteria bacterium]|nr:glycosyltransferase family 1 protein [Candidatus Falkowbacteria bacterium]
MIVAFNLLPYTEVSGLEIYAAELIRHLQLDPQDQTILFTNQKSAELFKNLQPRAIIKTKNFRHLNRLTITLYQQFAFIKVLRRAKVDLLFCPSLAAPLAWRKKIVVIHDLAFLRFKQESGRIFRVYLRLAIWSAKNWSLKIAAISEFSRQEISSLLKIAPEKIPIISFGAPELADVDTDFAGQTLKKFNLIDSDGNKRKYWLYLGAGYYRKNLNRLLEAFSLFSQERTEQNDSNCYLVLAGRQDAGFKKLAERLDSEPALATLKDKIIFSGLISEAAKTVLLKNSLALVLVSLYEGFGIPLLEAQAAGTAVLSSRSSALPEVAGAGAYFVDPLDTKAIKDALSFLYLNPDARQKLIKLGVANLSRYSWDKTAANFNLLLRTIK